MKFINYFYLPLESQLRIIPKNRGLPMIPMLMEVEILASIKGNYAEHYRYNHPSLLQPLMTEKSKVENKTTNDNNCYIPNYPYYWLIHSS